MSSVLRILITAGPTREYLDSVRYISNDSSGKMGFALARAAAARGHRVTVVHGPVALDPPAGVRCVGVVSADQMLRACRRAWPRHDVLIMAAAVADYAPAKLSKHKLKKRDTQMVLALRPTVDVLATLSKRRHAGQIVIGFALEDRAPRRHAAEKLDRKRLDAIILNSPRAIGADGATQHVLVRGERWRRLSRGDKFASAVRIIALVGRLADEATRRQSASKNRDAPASGNRSAADPS
ncbi:MAG: phosphopantothenoylcysteine decarboxylase [Phycisphaerae bacterium]